jgi:WD40 repeat protein
VSGAVAEPQVVGARLRSSPYVGLQPYGEDDSVFFFGREAERKILSANLGASRLTVLYAESGVGKSSVLRAGVASHLRRLAEQNAVERDGPRILPVVFSDWPDEPSEGLTRAIRTAASQFDGGSDLPVAALDETIAAVNDRLEARPMIILDQFEEYFRYHAAAAGDAFAEQFVTAANRPDLRAGFIVAIREDALARLDLFQGRIPDLLANYVRMDHLDVKAARAAIERPLQVYDELLERQDDPRRGSVPSSAEPRLVEEVLRQVAAGGGDRDGGRLASGGRIETPHLQLVLRRLWDEECETGSTELRLATLEAIGGAQRIIETHLDETMTTLTEPERDLAAHLFRQFVTPSGTKYAHTIPDLVDLTDQPEPEIAAVLDKLARPGSQILRAVAPAPGKTDGYRYEITHDVLGRAVLDWRRRHEEEDKDQRVAAAEEEAREANEKHLRERRRARIFRGLTIWSLVLLGLSIAAGVYAYRARTHANEEAASAASSAVGRKASTLIDQKYRSDAALLAALEAYHLKPTFEARRAVLAGLQADPSLGGELAGHYWPLSAVAFSPNSRLVATGSEDGTVRLWRAGTREPVGKALLPGVFGAEDLVFLDDSTLVIAGYGGFAIWDVTNPEKPHHVSTPSSGSAVSVSYAPDAKVLAVGMDDETSELWNVSDPAHATLDRDLKKAADDIAISADGSRIAAIAKHGLYVWGPDSGPVFRKGTFASVAVSPDGQVVATGAKGFYGPIEIWSSEDPSDPHVVKDLSGHLARVTSLAFNSDGSRLVSGGNDNAVLLWDVASGLPIGGPRTHTARVTAVAFAKDGHFASAGRDWVARIWRGNGSTLATMLGSPSGDTGSIAVASGGLLAAVVGERTLLWRTGALRSAQPNASEVLHDRRRDGKDRDQSLVVAGGRVMAVSTGDDIAVWLVLRGSRPTLLGRLPDDADTIAITPDGTRLATANGYDTQGNSTKGRVRIWDLRDPGKKTPLAERRVTKETINDLAFRSDGKVVAAALDDGGLRLLRVAPGKLIIRGKIFNAHVNSTLSVAFNPDDTTLASGGWDDQIILWNVADPARPRRLGAPLPPQPTIINTLAFSHDGKLLAAGVGNGDVVLWDVQQRETLGSPLATAPGNETSDSVRKLAFAPGDRFLVAGGSGLPVVVWSSALWSDDFPTLRRNVCAIVHRDLTEAEWTDFFGGTPFEDKREPTCSGEDNR